MENMSHAIDDFAAEHGEGMDGAESFAGRLLDAERENDGASESVVAREMLRVVSGLSLSAIFGAAIGARGGFASALIHAMRTPVVVAAVVALAVPALWVGVTYFGGKLAPSQVARLAGIVTAKIGLLLAGFAPIALLYVATSDSVFSRSAVALVPLAVGAIFGVRDAANRVWDNTTGDVNGTNALGVVAVIGAYSLFALVLGLRLAFRLLPVLTGGS